MIEEEEEKEVDPSLVGSLDNVYTEAPGTMPGEDPFKRVPMMVDNEKPANLMEMEKTLEAMEASIDQDSLQESDSSDDMSNLDSGVRRPRANQVKNENPFSRVMSPPSEGGIELGVMASRPPPEHRALTQQHAQVRQEEEVGGRMMPDLVAGGTATQPDIQLSSQSAPDVTTHRRDNPPDLATDMGQGSKGRAVDLLDSANATQSSKPPSSSQPLDLTDGLLHLNVAGGNKELDREQGES